MIFFLDYPAALPSYNLKQSRDMGAGRELNSANEIILKNNFALGLRMYSLTMYQRDAKTW